MVKRRRDSLDIEEVEQLPPRVRRVIKYQESDDDASLESDDLGASDLDQQMESDEVSEHVVNGDLSETDKNGSLLVTLPIGRDKAREIEVVDGQGSHPHSQTEEEGSEKEGSDNDNDREENIIQAQLKQEMKEAQEDKDNHDIIPRSRVGRKSVVNDEDEYVEDEEDSNEEDSPDHSSDSDVHSFDYDSGFVVDSDDNKIKRPRRSQRRGRRKLLQGTRSSSRRKNTRSRRTIASESDYSGSSDSNGNEGDDDQLNLQQELEELRDSDSADIPRRKHLRARKEINYQILPPPTNDDPMETMAVETPSHPRGGGRRGGTNGMIRRLFPTTGPFGGNDVISIFGTPAGHGMAGGVGTVDSDSSDEENAGSKFKSGPIGARKKPELADTDPLGVDMNIDFSAVGGLDNYINQLKEMVTLPLRYPEVYQRFGVTPPRGVLFHGPPGTGKTLMARALAASASSEGKKITFFMRKGADCLSKWVGEAERQLRILFEEAKNQQPSIIFFDEIDGLAPVRSSKQEQIHASIVSTLLALMDGMDNRGQVIVIGATNRPDSVDSALRRPGRFDREFYFPLPDLEARKKIISIHTKKWNPPVEPNFINHIAQLTKGYGGADLRALCTEAALNAIQRRYPQIYTSNKKLLIDASLIDVAPVDFLKSYEKIIPSSARSTSSGAVPLPTRIEPLLGKTFENISKKLDHILPRQKKLTALEEAMFENNDLSFSHQERVRDFQLSRIYRPRLLIHGAPGMGQQYIGAAILHHLEGFHIQSLDLGTLFSDSARTPEATLIQLMIEAKRHTPSVVFIPNLDSWYATITETTRSTFYGILRSLNPNDAILILGIVEVDFHELDPGLKALFGFSSENRHSINIEGGKDCLEKFFATAISYIRSKPTEFPDPENRKKRVLEELPEAPAEPEKQLTKQEIKQQEKKDMQLKNLLKVKLSGLMDLFKNRFKRFRKPPVDDSYLVHLFEDPLPNLPPPAYTKTDDDMILEVATGKKYFNIDLDIIEERLWNGFYSEPKQFLRDLEMIYLDANVTGDRERTVKASEMFANAQVAIEEIETVDPQFIQNCKELHQREITRQKKSLQKNQKEAVDGGVVGDSVTRNDISGDGESITDNIVQKMEDLADGSGPKEADSSAVASSLHTTTTTTTTSTVSTDASVATISSTATTITASTNHATMDAYDTKPELPIDISSKLIKGQKNSLSTHFDISSEDIEMHDDVDISLNGSANGSKDTDGNDGVALQPTPSVVSPAKTLSISALVDSTSSSSEKLSDAAASKEKLIENGSCSIELAEPEPLLILDELKLKDFTEHLIESCRLFNVEQLEQVNALITDQVWSLRHSWNRNEIIDKLYISFDEAKSVIESINSF